MRGRRALRRLGLLLGTLAIVFGVLWVAFPARIEEPDGPADPILPARRFVLGVLRHVGVVDEPFFSPDPLLPSAPSSTAWSGAEGPDVAREMGTWTSVRWRVAPVSRALLVPVGFRVELTY